MLSCACRARKRQDETDPSPLQTNASGYIYKELDAICIIQNDPFKERPAKKAWRNAHHNIYLARLFAKKIFELVQGAEAVEKKVFRPGLL